MTETLMTIEQLAECLHTTAGAVYTMRSCGKGPRSIRVGRRVLFRASDVEAWLSEHTTDAKRCEKGNPHRQPAGA